MAIFFIKKWQYFWLVIFLVCYIFSSYIFGQNMVIFLVVIFFIIIFLVCVLLELYFPRSSLNMIVHLNRQRNGEISDYYFIYNY